MEPHYCSSRDELRSHNFLLFGTTGEPHFLNLGHTARGAPSVTVTHRPPRPPRSCVPPVFPHGIRDKPSAPSQLPRPPSPSIPRNPPNAALSSSVLLRRTHLLLETPLPPPIPRQLRQQRQPASAAVADLPSARGMRLLLLASCSRLLLAVTSSSLSRWPGRIVCAADGVRWV